MRASVGTWPGACGFWFPPTSARTSIRRPTVGSRSIAARRTGGFVLPGLVIRTRRAARLVLPGLALTRRTRRPVLPWLAVAVAPRRSVLVAIFFRPRALRPVLFLEPIARILVRSARTPVARPFLHGPHRAVLRGALRLWRVPQLSTREPLDHDVLVLALELIDRRQQLFAIARTERGRLAVDQDRPVHETRRHRSILAGNRA